MTTPAFRIPRGLAATFKRLESAGRDGWLVGDCVLATLRGERPISYEAITTATASEISEILDRAIPTARNSSVVTVPTKIGPLDFHVAREKDMDAESCLAQLTEREFSLLTPAFCARSARWFDPWGGLADLAVGRLCRVDEDRRVPASLGLRAARLIAEFGYEADPGVVSASQQSAEAVRRVPPMRLRRELTRLLLGPHCERGLNFLRDTGVEAALIADVRQGAAKLVASLPRQLPIRMTAWLDGTRARQLLRRGRFGFNFSQEIYALLEHSPIDESVSTANGAAVSRLIDQLGEESLADLFLLRESQIEILSQQSAAGTGVMNDSERDIQVKTARAQVEEMKAALERARARRDRARIRSQLALSGREVIEILACGEGPVVGRALNYLADVVCQHPEANTPETLRAQLEGWNPE